MASKDFKVKNGLTVTGDATVAGYSYLTFVTSNTLTVANTIVGTISSLANHSTSNVTEGSRREHMLIQLSSFKIQQFQVLSQAM